MSARMQSTRSTVVLWSQSEMARLTPPPSSALLPATVQFEGLTLREAVIADGALDGAQFDALVRPEDLARGRNQS